MSKTKWDELLEELRAEQNPTLEQVKTASKWRMADRAEEYLKNGEKESEFRPQVKEALDWKRSLQSQAAEQK